MNPYMSLGSWGVAGCLTCHYPPTTHPYGLCEDIVLASCFKDCAGRLPFRSHTLMMGSSTALLTWAWVPDTSLDLEHWAPSVTGQLTSIKTTRVHWHEDSLFLVQSLSPSPNTRKLLNWPSIRHQGHKQ